MVLNVLDSYLAGAEPQISRQRPLRLNASTTGELPLKDLPALARNEPRRRLTGAELHSACRGDGPAGGALPIKRLIA